MPRDSRPAAFSSLSFFVRLNAQLDSAVSCNSVNSNAVNNAVNNLLDRVGVYLCRLSLVTTRSERDSCNSYEHKY